MKPSKQGIDLIKQYEKLRLYAYLCPANKLTIGYGHVLLPRDYALFNVTMSRMDSLIRLNTANKKITIPLFITQAKADDLLERDIAQVARFLDSVTRTPLSQCQFDALCSFVFNVGESNYAASTLKRYVNAGDRLRASAELGRWVYATVDGEKVKLDGLVNRRNAEQRLFDSKVL